MPPFLTQIFYNSLLFLLCILFYVFKATAKLVDVIYELLAEINGEEYTVRDTLDSPPPTPPTTPLPKKVKTVDRTPSPSDSEPDYPPLPAPQGHPYSPRAYEVHKVVSRLRLRPCDFAKGFPTIYPDEYDVKSDPDGTKYLIPKSPGGPIFRRVLVNGHSPSKCTPSNDGSPQCCSGFPTSSPSP